MIKKGIGLILIIIFLATGSNVFANSYENPTIIRPDGTIVSNPLISLSHNCKNTGVMLPGEFNPEVSSYILTVASWVSKVNFTPTYNDPNTTVRINGKNVASNRACEDIVMNNEPAMVYIEVISGNNYYRNYTIFLQRRPSERRTRVSSGHIVEIYTKKNTIRMKVDLVKVNYKEGNVSNFVNESGATYDYAFDKNCILYYGTMNQPLRAFTIAEFTDKYKSYGSDLYRIVYIEDKIVAVMPYASDF